MEMSSYKGKFVIIGHSLNHFQSLVFIKGKEPSLSPKTSTNETVFQQSSSIFQSSAQSEISKTSLFSDIVKKKACSTKRSTDDFANVNDKRKKVDLQ